MSITPKTSKQAPAKAEAPVFVKANPARGEVPFSIGDASLLLVPSYSNLIRWEDELNLSYTEMVLGFIQSAPRYRHGHLVPMIQHLNDGDSIDREAISRWARANPEATTAVVNSIVIAILDPEGNKYNALSEEGAEVDPNV